MPEIFSSISCNLDKNILAAALPLFTAEKVDAIEWSFDTLFKFKNIPGWFIELLKTFGKENRLIGHGVYFSLFSGGGQKNSRTGCCIWKKYLKYFNSIVFPNILAL